MSIFRHEMRRGRISLIIWTAVISSMLALSVLIYPLMKAEMENMSEMLAGMGALSEAFSMDQLNFAEFSGYFALECGELLGLGGALFAAILSIPMLSKEQKDGTADFLLTHPISRQRVMLEKLGAIFAQILILNICAAAVTVLCALIIGEKPDAKVFFMLFLAFLLVQIEIACICFGISAFIKGSGIGIGIGLAVLLYFLNIVSNITKEAEFLKFITPFSYADGAEIVRSASIELKYLAVGAVLAIAGVAAAFLKYPKKDL